MSEMKTVSIVPLNGTNYPTWKLQCRMALMKDGLWGIVSGNETAPAAEAEKHAKFVFRRDRALELIVLSVEPSLLYLIGHPEDPVEVWKKLSEIFQKKTWANKLDLRRKLYTLQLKDGESIQKHIKEMTEIFESLAVIGDPVAEEDRVVQLLASLPDSFKMLVTALEANPEVPKMEIVTERLLHEERKLKDPGPTRLKAMTAQGQKKKFTCHYCGKPGHFRRNCRKLAADNKKKVKLGTREKEKHKANKAAIKKDEEDGSSSCDSDALVAFHALSVNSSGNWIVDSGATSHMCNNAKMFAKFKSLKRAQEVKLGDGHVLEAIGEGIVQVKMKLPNGMVRRCNLRNVLFVPKLAYNLLSVSKAAEAGKITKFDEKWLSNAQRRHESHCSSKESWKSLLPGMSRKSKSCTKQRKTLAPPVWTPWRAESDETSTHQEFRLRFLQEDWFLRNLYWW